MSRRASHPKSDHVQMASYTYVPTKWDLMLKWSHIVCWVSEQTIASISTCFLSFFLFRVVCFWSDDNLSFKWFRYHFCFWPRALFKWFSGPENCAWSHDLSSVCLIKKQLYSNGVNAAVVLIPRAYHVQMVSRIVFVFLVPNETPCSIDNNCCCVSVRK